MTDKPLTPDARARRPDIQGVSVTLADGHTWVLARGGLAPILTAPRDRLYDDVTLGRGQVRPGDVAYCAYVLLLHHYDLADAEVHDLLRVDDTTALSNAVLDAVFGPEAPRRTYTSWAMSALLANGIDPARVPAQLVPEVLGQLVATGRAVAESDGIDAAVAMAKRRKLLDSVK